MIYCISVILQNKINAIIAYKFILQLARKRGITLQDQRVKTNCKFFIISDNFQSNFRGPTNQMNGTILSFFLLFKKTQSIIFKLGHCAKIVIPLIFLSFLI